MNEVVAVVGLCVHKCEAGGWGLGQKPETECSSLGFGRAMSNGGLGRWGEVAELHG